MFLELLMKQRPYHKETCRPNFPKVFAIVRANMEGIEKAVKEGYSWTQIEKALNEVYNNDIDKSERFWGYARPTQLWTFYMTSPTKSESRGNSEVRRREIYP